MKKRTKILLAIAVLLIVLGVVVVSAIRGFAADAARKFLKEKNVPVHTLSLESLTPNAITLRDIVLGEDKNFKAKNLIITRISGTSLENIRVRVEADGVEIHATHNGKDWALGGVEHLWQPGSNSDNNHAEQSASFDLVDGKLDVTGSLNADIEGIITAQALNYQAKGLNAALSKLQITPKVTGGAQQKLTVPFTVEKVTARNDKGLLITPLRAKGNIYHVLKSDALQGTVTATDLSQKLRVDSNIAHRLAASKGTVTFKTNQIAFGEKEGTLSLAELLPAIAGKTPTPSMQFQTDGTLQYAANGLKTITGKVHFSRLQAAGLLAQALPNYGNLEGELKGDIPFTLTPDSWQIKNGTIENATPMKLSILKGNTDKVEELASNVAALFGKKIKVNNFDGVNISTLSLLLNSVNKQGDVSLRGKLNGHNPLLKRPVNLNVDLQTNLNNLLGTLSIKRATK